MTNDTNVSSNNTLTNTLEKLDESLNSPLGGEIIAGFVATTLHMFIQIASINSRHMAVAFKIPSETTGIYFTKLFSVRGLVYVSASITTYLIKLCISEDNIVLTLAFCSLIFISRTVFMLFLHIAKNKALYIYNIFIMDAISIGLFQMTFYPLTTEYVSALSLCFKISRILIFGIQLVMDVVIYDRPLLIIKIHYWLAYIMTLIGTFLWFHYCISRNNRGNKKSKHKSQKSSETEDTTSSCLENGTSRNATAQTKEEKVEATEPTFLQHLGNSMSPLFMCLVTLILKNILSPGILPYGILERDKCHLINMAITPVGLLGTLIVHGIKKNVDSINRSWEWYWHLFWLLAIPPGAIFYKTIAAIHSRPSSSKIINNRKVVFVFTIIFFLCHTIIESAGYLGVVSNVKHCNEVREKGRKMVSTNQLLGEITYFISYKISVGYNVTRIDLGYHLPKFRPTHKMSKGNLLSYILSHTFTHAYKDFINDFKMNIREYI